MAKIRYFESVSSAANLRTKIQKNVIDDLNMKGEERKEEFILNSRFEDLDEMTAALKKCEQNAVSVNKVVEKIRANGQLKYSTLPLYESKNDV